MVVVDILLGVVYLLLVVVFYIGGNKIVEIQIVCIIRQVFVIGIYCVILCNYFVVVVDRYIVILYLMRYYVLMKKRNIVFVLIIIWISSCFFTILLVIIDFIKGNYSRIDKVIFCGSFREIWLLVDKYGIFLFLVIIISIFVILYIRIYLVVYK